MSNQQKTGREHNTKQKTKNLTGLQENLLANISIRRGVCGVFLYFCKLAFSEPKLYRTSCGYNNLKQKVWRYRT